MRALAVGFARELRVPASATGGVLPPVVRPGVGVPYEIELIEALRAVKVTHTDTRVVRLVPLEQCAWIEVEDEQPVRRGR